MLKFFIRDYVHLQLLYILFIYKINSYCALNKFILWLLLKKICIDMFENNNVRFCIIKKININIIILS